MIAPLKCNVFSGRNGEGTRPVLFPGAAGQAGNIFYPVARLRLSGRNFPANRIRTGCGLYNGTDSRINKTPSYSCVRSVIVNS